jgi:hypothetical protein
LLDNDKAGREGFDKAQKAGVLVLRDTNFVVCDGMADSEMEDLYEVAVYESAISKEYGISLQNPRFRTSGKWSDRMRETFRNQGKTWNDSLEADVKLRVADLIAKQPGSALKAHKRSSFDALVKTLEGKLGVDAPPAAPAAAVQDKVDGGTTAPVVPPETVSVGVPEASLRSADGAPANPS